MKILILILILISSNAQARSKLHDVSKEDLTRMYKRNMKVVTDKEKIFIAGGILSCASERGLKAIRTYSLNHSGKVNYAFARSASCRITEGWAIGIADEVDNKNQQISLVFDDPAGRGVRQAYFNINDVMTLADRKALSGSN